MPACVHPSKRPRGVRGRNEICIPPEAPPLSAHLQQSLDRYVAAIFSPARRAAFCVANLSQQISFWLAASLKKTLAESDALKALLIAILGCIFAKRVQERRNFL